MAGGEKPAVDKAIPFVLFALAIGIAAEIAAKYLPRRLNPPFSVVVFVIAFAFGALAHTDWGLGSLGESIHEWEHLHAHVILFVFLPPLLFESAFAMDFHIFSRVAGQAVLLAAPGVIVAVGLTASLIKLCFASYGWDWPTCLLLGSILSATDPVAVVAVLQTLGAPHKLSTVVEGESLLNDGSAVVLFLVFKDMAGHVDAGVGSIIVDLIRLAFGGPLFGIVCAYLAVGVLHMVYNHPNVEISLLLAIVYAVFFIAEAGLHTSGVLAVVCFGLTFAYSGKYALSREVRHANHSVWQEVGWLANTVIFALAGVIIHHRMVVASDIASDGTNWGYLFLLYFLLHVVRGTVVTLFWPFLRKMGYGLKWQEGVSMVYGGLRGAVGLALGLLVEVDQRITNEHTKALMMFHIAGIVCLTLLVNGTTAGDLYNYLQIYPVSPFKPKMFAEACKSIEREMNRDVEEMRVDALHIGIRSQWSTVKALMPAFNRAKLDTKTGRVHVHSQSVQSVFTTAVHKTRVHNRLRAAMRLIVLNNKRQLAKKAAAAAGPKPPVPTKRSRSAPTSTTTGSGEVLGADAETTAAEMVHVVVPRTASGDEKAMEAFLTGDEAAALGIDEKPEHTAAAAAAALGASGRSPTAAAHRNGAKSADRSWSQRASGAGILARGSSTTAVAAAAPAADAAMPMPALPRRRGSMLPSLHQASSRNMMTTAQMPAPGAGAVAVAMSPASYLDSTSARGLNVMMSKSAQYGAVFNSLKATFFRMYDDQLVDDAALLVLTESCDAGSECAQRLGNFELKELPLDTQLPFEAASEVVATIVELPLVARTIEYLRCDKCTSLDDAARFNYVRVAVEGLQGLLLAYSEAVLEVDRIAPSMAATLKREMGACMLRARALLTAVEHEHQAVCSVLRTIVPAKALLGRLKLKVNQLHEARGMIDHKMADDLAEAIDERVLALQAFVPAPKLVAEMQKVPTGATLYDSEGHKIRRQATAHPHSRIDSAMGRDAQRRITHSTPDSDADKVVASALKPASARSPLRAEVIAGGVDTTVDIGTNATPEPASGDAGVAAAASGPKED